MRLAVDLDLEDALEDVEGLVVVLGVRRNDASAARARLEDQRGVAVGGLLEEGQGPTPEADDPALPLVVLVTFTCVSLPIGLTRFRSSTGAVPL
jgi:hypothetical protein